MEFFTIPAKVFNLRLLVGAKRFKPAVSFSVLVPRPALCPMRPYVLKALDHYPAYEPSGFKGY